MKAIIRDEYGPPEVLSLVDIDTPVPSDHEVLVRVHAAGVNMADVDFMLGRPDVARLITGWRGPRNRGLGLDVAGEVESVGRKVKGLRPGDEVFGDLTEHGYGAFAEYACARETAFAPKPTNLSFEQAATVPQAGVMAIQGLRSKGSIKPGDKVLINGAGGNVGPFAVQIAKSYGAEVTAVDSSKKLDMLRSIGADRVIDYAQVDVATNGDRYDRILDVAAFRPISDWKDVLLPGGVYITVPNSIRGMITAVFKGPLIARPSGRKMGMSGGQPFDRDDVAALTELIEAGSVTPVIERRYSLEEVPEALRVQMEGHPVGKLVITI